jgi:hypothetical protein
VRIGGIFFNAIFSTKADFNISLYPHCEAAMRVEANVLNAVFFWLIWVSGC